MDLPGNAFVTGGGSGIGSASCIAFAKAGVAGLLVADINMDSALKTASDAKTVATNPGFRAEAVHVDVALSDSVERATTIMIETFGRIDYCVNCAGVNGEPTGIAETGLDSFKRVMDINVQGTFLVSKYISAAMAKQELRTIDDMLPARGQTRGVITNMGSVASFLSIPRSVSYTASKHAVVGLTKSSDTPLVRGYMSKFAGLEQFILSQIPMGRMGLPEEIADAVVFLSSDKASWINGTSVMVDGGMTFGVYTPNRPAASDVD